mmetsp:Transcript_24094/g.74276  ORF Transcript_24094/g.74276 Transcript_24094/m.74276 type:complete len:231 (+) Transcript_24094:266-958(+)
MRPALFVEAIGSMTIAPVEHGSCPARQRERALLRGRDVSHVDEELGHEFKRQRRRVGPRDGLEADVDALDLFRFRVVEVARPQPFRQTKMQTAERVRVGRQEPVGRAVEASRGRPALDDQHERAERRRGVAVRLEETRVVQGQLVAGHDVQSDAARDAFHDGDARSSHDDEVREAPVAPERALDVVDDVARALRRLLRLAARGLGLGDAGRRDRDLRVPQLGLQRVDLVD